MTEIYPVGTPGIPWGEEERRQWRGRRKRQRHYDRDVVPRIDALAGRFRKIAYGRLEATALIGLVASVRNGFLLHIDLHETTDSDESEFRPALAARDGTGFEPGLIPDGFYLVDDTENPQPEFQRAVIAAVAGVTHIAPPDANGEIIGSPVVAHGVIEYPLAKLGLATSVTGARYTTITEVYPDSARTSPEECVRAQVTAVCAALDYALAHR